MAHEPMLITLPPLTDADLRRMTTRFTSALIHGTDILVRVKLAWVIVTREAFVHDPSRRKADLEDGIEVGRYVRPCPAPEFREDLLHVLSRVRLRAPRRASSKSQQLELFPE